MTVVTNHAVVASAALIVNCAGAWGAAVATLLGDRVALTADSSMVTTRMLRCCDWCGLK